MWLTPSDLVLLRRTAALQEAADRGSDFAPAPGPIVVRVVNLGQLPTSGNTYVACHRVVCGGPEVEGGAAVLTESDDVFYAAVIGSTAPKAGDNLIARPVPSGRWAVDVPVAPEDQGGVTLSPCPCKNIPAVLHMSVNNPALNLGMFQETTLVYGPTPPEYLPVGIGIGSYLSPGSFTDQVTGDSFRYWFMCYLGYYGISRVYARSVLGSPYRDMIRYSWLANTGPSNYGGFTVDPTGGGFFGGALIAGNYTIGATETNAVGETLPYITRVTLPFNGTIARITFGPLVNGHTAHNVYLKYNDVPDDAPTALVRYATGVTTSTFDLVGPITGTIRPPSVDTTGTQVIYNECYPFNMNRGQVYPGGDPSCIVTITG